MNSGTLISLSTRSSEFLAECRAAVASIRRIYEHSARVSCRFNALQLSQLWKRTRPHSYRLAIPSTPRLKFPVSATIHKHDYRFRTQFDHHFPRYPHDEPHHSLPLPGCQCPGTLLDHEWIVEWTQRQGGGDLGFMEDMIDRGM